MTEQELRNKIAKHVCCACEMGLGDGECAEVSDYRKCGVCGDVADALIAAGIGDVEDAEYRAEKAEQLKNQYCRALLNLARRYVVKTNMTLSHGNEPHSRSTDIEMLALYIIANECEQAEKELAEEGKDEN